MAYVVKNDVDLLNAKLFLDFSASLCTDLCCSLVGSLYTDWK